MTDIAIIGAGPAGLSAAVNVAARNKSCVVYGRDITTSPLYKAREVNNHLGMPQASGKEMLESFRDHALKLGVEIKTGRVVQVLPMGDSFSLNVDNEPVQARAVIIATGKPVKAGAKGESALLGKGVSYCATCDGMFYRGKNVVVAGELPEAEEDVNFLSGICEKVTYVHSYDWPNVKGDVETIRGAIDEVLGTDSVTGVRIGDRTLDCDGVFFIWGAVPPESLITGLEMSNGAIKVNRTMETNIKGLFAAGDCTGWPWQVAKAVGEGLIAAQQCARYLKE